MSGIFLAVILVLGAGFAAVVVDGLTARPAASLPQVAFVTRLPGPALSVSYFEPRCRVYGDFSDTFHPGMRPLHAMDFIYAR